MSDQGNPEPDRRPDRARWLIWAGGTVVALYFIADGLLGIWPDAGGTTRVVIVVAVVLGLVVASVGVAYLARRGRAG